MTKARNAKATVGVLSRGVVSRAVKDVLSSRAEHKRITATNAYADLSTAGAVSSPLQAIGQGDDINARTGDQILVERMKFRVTFQLNAANFSFYTARVIVVSDTLNNGSIPAVTDILATADVLSGYSQTAAQQHRFKVLIDQRVSLVGQTTTAVVNYDKDMKLNKRVYYNAASGATSHGRNAIFILFIADTASAGVNRFKWSHETTYTDI